MEAEQARTLSAQFPDAFLALLKRMTRAERTALLKEFAAQYPKDYAAWLTADVRTYLKFLDQ